MQGILVGFRSFLLTGLFHPVARKTEYHLTERTLPALLLVGTLCLAGVYFAGSQFASSTLGVMGFCCSWSVKKFFGQEKGVEKGWAPRSPKHDRE